MRHLLVTNDFPPKVGGIQSYLWELWRRLPADEVTVLTTSYPGAESWDRSQDFPIRRVPERVLLPTPSLRRRIDALADEIDAELVVLDPALPLGLLGEHLARPYVVVLHGAEITVPGRVPPTRQLLARVLDRARGVITAGHYGLAEAERALGRRLESIVVPPGVDVERFQPLDASRRTEVRERLGLDSVAPLVVGVSRLVPRKGFDVLVQAAHRLVDEFPEMQVAIAGVGRDRARLERLAAAGPCPIRFMGRLPDAALRELDAVADVFVMLCRNRWAGLEAEGFGIVFLEAAACGVPQVAGNSGGAAEAVVDGETGFVVDDPSDLEQVTHALRRLLADGALRTRLGIAARARAVDDFSYDVLATRLRDGLLALATPAGDEA